MAKEVPFFTYVLDLPELYLWWSTEKAEGEFEESDPAGGSQQCLLQPTGLTACDVQQGAVNGGHPQVGRTRVKHHGEGLGRRAQTNLTIILSLRQKVRIQPREHVSLELLCNQGKIKLNRLEPMRPHSCCQQMLRGHRSNSYRVMSVNQLLLFKQETITSNFPSCDWKLRSSLLNNDISVESFGPECFFKTKWRSRVIYCEIDFSAA